jgi:hypothetical protein
VVKSLLAHRTKDGPRKRPCEPKPHRMDQVHMYYLLYLKATILSIHPIPPDKNRTTSTTHICHKVQHSTVQHNNARIQNTKYDGAKAPIDNSSSNFPLPMPTIRPRRYVTPASTLSVAARWGCPGARPPTNIPSPTERQPQLNRSRHFLQLSALHYYPQEDLN